MSEILNHFILIFFFVVPMLRQLTQRRGLLCNHGVILMHEDIMFSWESSPGISSVFI